MSTWWGFVIPANWFSRPWKVLRGFSILDHLWGIYSVTVNTPTISSPKVPSSGKIGKEVFSTPCHKVFNFSHSTFGHDLVPPWSRSQHLNASRLWQKHLLFYGNTPLCGAMTPTMGSDDRILYNFVWRSSCVLLRFLKWVSGVIEINLAITMPEQTSIINTRRNIITIILSILL